MSVLSPSLSMSLPTDQTGISLQKSFLRMFHWLRFGVLQAAS
jgi:hypothetical protein